MSKRKAAVPPPKNIRLLWRPKLPEMAVQCASCPFRVGNHKEFGEVIQRLKIAHGQGSRITNNDIICARLTVLRDADSSGDFACHHSAYDENMKVRPQSEHRQCPGASGHYRAMGEKAV